MKQRHSRVALIHMCCPASQHDWRRFFALLVHQELTLTGIHLLSLTLRKQWIWLCSGYVQRCVQSVFRVCSECVQSVFRVCSDCVQSVFPILKSFHHLAHLECQFLPFFYIWSWINKGKLCSIVKYKTLPKAQWNPAFGYFYYIECFNSISELCLKCMFNIKQSHKYLQKRDNFWNFFWKCRIGN